MSRSSRSIFLILPIATIMLSVHPGVQAAQQPGTPAAGNATRQDSADYGAVGHRDQDTEITNGVLHGRVYDGQGTLRQEETDTYLPSDHKQKKEKDLLYFDPKGHFTLSADYKYDLHGGLSSTDFIHYGLHGERTWEEITDYRSDGYESKDWSLGKNSWLDDFNPYKMPPKTGAPPPFSAQPTTVNVGVLVPRNFHPGDDIVGSLHLASYADNFKVVPGFSEFDFGIQVYHLPDGSPEWSSLEIGVKGNGYFPVNANGLFSLHIPMTWNGPLQLQALQPDPLAGLGPGSATIDIGSPVAAPSLPSHDYLANIQDRMQYFTAEHLVDLWEEAYDREVELDDAYDDPSYSDEEIANLEDDLDDCYDEIDHVIYNLPPKVVVDLANGMAKDGANFSLWLSQLPNLTPDDRDDLDDSNGWVSFLSNEADHASFMSMLGTSPTVQPFWANPILTQGKLGAIRGTFDDPFSLHLGIDGKPISPIAATPTEFYFLPPGSLAPGLHNYILDSPVYGETTLPVFYMTLTMWADQLNLHKGQSTTYHVKLDGTNGLPGGAWSSPFYPTDLVALPAGSGIQSSASSRTGTITLEVTNQSRGTISMQDEFRTLDAANFAPSGSYQLDGGVHAIKDGDFSIYGEARAYLNPELGLGPGANAPPPAYGPAGSAYMPGLNFSYDQSWTKSSPLLTMCSSESAAGAPPCMDKEVKSIYDRAIGNQSPIEVQDQNQPDLTQLPKAANRAEQAAKKVKAADSHSGDMDSAETAAWQQALSNAPAETREEWQKSVENLRKAEEAQKKYKAKYDANPNDDNEFLLAATNQDVAVAINAQQAARDKLINSFKPEDRKAYETVHESAEGARKELDAARKEDREAREALAKLKQAALNH